MRIEDVGAEQLQRIRGQRMRHPRHHPDAPAAVVGVEPSGVAEVDDVGIGEDAREDDRRGHDDRRFGEPAEAHVCRMVACRSHTFVRGSTTCADVPSGAIALLVSWLPAIHEARARARRGRRAGAAHSRLRLRHRIESRDAARRTGSAVGFDLTATGVRFARAHGQTVAQASIAAIPFRSRRLRSRHLVRRLSVSAG